MKSLREVDRITIERLERELSTLRHSVETRNGKCFTECDNVVLKEVVEKLHQEKQQLLLKEENEENNRNKTYSDITTSKVRFDYKNILSPFVQEKATKLIGEVLTQMPEKAQSQFTTLINEYDKVERELMILRSNTNRLNNENEDRFQKEDINQNRIDDKIESKVKFSPKENSHECDQSDLQDNTSYHDDVLKLQIKRCTEKIEKYETLMKEQEDQLANLEEEVSAYTSFAACLSRHEKKIQKRTTIDSQCINISSKIDTFESDECLEKPDNFKMKCDQHVSPDEERGIDWTLYTMEMQIRAITECLLSQTERHFKCKLLYLESWKESASKEMEGYQHIIGNSVPVWIVNNLIAQLRFTRNTLRRSLEREIDLRSFHNQLIAHCTEQNIASKKKAKIITSDAIDPTINNVHYSGGETQHNKFFESQKKMECLQKYIHEVESKYVESQKLIEELEIEILNLKKNKNGGLSQEDADKLKAQQKTSERLYEKVRIENERLKITSDVLSKQIDCLMDLNLHSETEIENANKITDDNENTCADSKQVPPHSIEILNKKLKNKVYQMEVLSTKNTAVITELNSEIEQLRQTKVENISPLHAEQYKSNIMCWNKVWSKISNTNEICDIRQIIEHEKIFDIPQEDIVRLSQKVQQIADSFASHEKMREVQNKCIQEKTNIINLMAEDNFQMSCLIRQLCSSKNCESKNLTLISDLSSRLKQERMNQLRLKWQVEESNSTNKVLRETIISLKAQIECFENESEKKSKISSKSRVSSSLMRHNSHMSCEKEKSIPDITQSQNNMDGHIVHQQIETLKEALQVEKENHECLKEKLRKKENEFEHMQAIIEKSCSKESEHLSDPSHEEAAQVTIHQLKLLLQEKNKVINSYRAKFLKHDEVPSGKAHSQQPIKQHFESVATQTIDIDEMNPNPSDQYDQRLDMLVVKTRKLTASLKEKDTKIFNQRNTISNLEETNERIERRRQEAVSEIALLTKNACSLDKKLETSEMKLSLTQEQNESFNAQLKEKEAQIISLETTVGKLKTSLSRLGKRNRSTVSKLNVESNNGKIPKNKSIIDLEAEVSRGKIKLSGFMRSKEKCERELLKAKETISSMSDDISKLEKQITSLKGSNLEIIQEKNSALARVKKISDKVQQMEKAQEDHLEQKEIITDLNSKISRLNEQNASLRSHVAANKLKDDQQFNKKCANYQKKQLDDKSNQITDAIEIDNQNTHNVLKTRGNKSIPVSEASNSDCVGISDVQDRNKMNVVRNQTESPVQVELCYEEFREDGYWHTLEHEFLIDLKERVRKVRYQIIKDGYNHYIKGIDSHSHCHNIFVRFISL